MFEVGDWIKHSSGDIFQYKKFMRKNFGEEFQKWSPKEGDWVIFRPSEPYTGNAFTVIRWDDKWTFDKSSCEPFIGDLPSFFPEAERS